MIDDQRYVVLSLELHMFFARIMKEHALFLEAGFTPANARFGEVADEYKKQFGVVLGNAVQLGNGIITPAAAESGEMVTDYTLGSELKTEHFTGISIDTDITRQQSRLWGLLNANVTPALVGQVQQLNQGVMPLLDGFIAFKRQVWNEVVSCNMFTTHYPLEIDHLLREANEYKRQLVALESRQDPSMSVRDEQMFWNQIMMEHGLFIRGQLDPTENELIKTANGFAKDYSDLIRAAKESADVTEKTIRETVRFRDFKAAGTKGINECKVRGITLPLLADHVLREANHYLRLLG